MYLLGGIKPLAGLATIGKFKKYYAKGHPDIGKR